jgi:hypothetical protein
MQPIVDTSSFVHMALTILTTIALGLVGWYAKGLEKRLDKSVHDTEALRAAVHDHSVVLAVHTASAEPTNKSIQEIKDDLNSLMADISRMTVLLATLEGRVSSFMDREGYGQ